MRRKDKELDESKALAIVDSCVYGVLSNLNDDGSPYGVPISPALVGKSVYFHGFKSGLKLDNIAKDNRVCLTCVGRTEVLSEEYSTDYESAIIFGTAELITDKEEFISGLRAICEKYSMDHMDKFDDAIMKEGSHTSLCKIVIEEITGKATAKFK